MTDEERRALGIDAEECPSCGSPAYHHYHGDEECPACMTPTKRYAHFWMYKHPQLIQAERARSAKLIEALRSYEIMAGDQGQSVRDAIAEYEAGT